VAPADGAVPPPATGAIAVAAMAADESLLPNLATWSQGREYSLIRRAGKPLIGLELGMDSLDPSGLQWTEGAAAVAVGRSTEEGEGPFAKYRIHIRGYL
jgi:hypothetical protein